MPNTRSQGAADGGSLGSGGNIAQPAELQQQSAEPPADDSTGGVMEVQVPTDLHDKLIVQLRAGVTRIKKELDSLVKDINEQVLVIGTAVSKDTPAETVPVYIKESSKGYWMRVIY